MKSTTIFNAIFASAFATAAVLASFAPTFAADTMKKENYPELKPGEITLAYAELPTTTGGTWNGGDARPLGGINELDESKTETLNVLLYQPTDESAKTDAGFPLLLFLHGAGERGDNPELLKVHGPFKRLSKEADFGKTWKFFSAAPQCPGARFWSPKQVIALIEEICANYPIDRSRIYVTGISMGGFGTWGVIAASDGLVAAAAPICGGYDVKFAPQMTEPIWTFHGTADGAVPYDLTKNLVAAVKEAGNDDVQFTTYEGFGHDCWTVTYENEKLYDWFLSKKIEK